MKTTLRILNWIWSTFKVIGETIIIMPITTTLVCGIVLLICAITCTSKDKEDDMYRNFDMIIVGINGTGFYNGNGQTSLSNDKFHRPETCNIILFETTNAFETKFNTSHLYREINTCSDLIISEGSYSKFGFTIDTKWLYNHQAGDVVHFAFMRKDRFFKSPLLDSKRKYLSN